MFLRLSLVICFGAACWWPAARCAANDATVDFEGVIQPLLMDKCGHCHGPTVHKADLDLSSSDGIRRGGESGEPLLASQLDDSLLWQLVESGEMPPPGEPELDQGEIELLRRWIETSGAMPEIEVPGSAELTEHDVLPMVLLRCTTCHGARLKSGDLDLRTHQGMLVGGKSGPAMVPGDPDGSLMIRRIESGECPPSELLLKFFVRRPASSEIQRLRDWIEAGAPRGDVQVDVATTSPDRLVSDEDRQHWAFQPPQPSMAGHCIDDFIRAKLRQVDLELSPSADRDTLIRRVYLDVIGMPPSLEELRRWRLSRDPDWYSRMVDHVLASPHYGERWGRYWLDLAGYADSEGGISADPIRPVAWKYRDYVIRAFNDDKPYDQFLIEQIAGDELIDHESASVITDEMVDNLVATGFLRMGIDETGSRTMNFVPERLKVISDAITVVSSGLMGMTMECARCHSHKYDPIPQRDYYRFKAVFQGAFDEHDWSSFKTRKLNVGTPEHRRRLAETNPPLEKAAKRLETERKRLTDELQLTLLRHHYPDQSEDDNEATLRALRIADNTRTLPQRLLVERLQRAEILPDGQQPKIVLEMRRRIASTEREIHLIRRRMVPPVTIRALWDVGRPSPTYILRRGEHDQPGRPVGPGVPSVLTDGKTPFAVEPPFPGGTNKTGRRLAFARWLTQPDHPLTARVMVNRIWYHHFGTGLVRTLDNFGVQGERPTHPELLDWLALEFVRSGWSIKSVHRLILGSRTYRQSSRITDQHRRLDPSNEYYSRMPLRRLDAESLRDSLLFVSGQLDDSPGGIPDAVSVDRDGLVDVEAGEGGGWRRSIYAQFRRTEIPTMMQTFDYPQMGPNCLQRSVSNVSPQALMLMNNHHVRDLAGALAARVCRLQEEKLREENGSVSSGDRVELVYQLALSRMPSDQERTIAIEALEQFEQGWEGDSQRALETFCHAILNSASFLYID